jgi:hypothetical protein
LLGLVHRSIGIFQQYLCGFPIVGIKGYPDTQTHSELCPIGLVGAEIVSDNLCAILATLKVVLDFGIPAGYGVMKPVRQDYFIPPANFPNPSVSRVIRLQTYSFHPIGKE